MTATLDLIARSGVIGAWFYAIAYGIADAVAATHRGQQ